MSSEGNRPRSALLNQVIADYLAAVESGNAPDREELIRQHSDLADNLRSFLADHDRMKSARAGIEVPTLPPNPRGLEAATIPPGDPTEAGGEDMTLPPRLLGSDGCRSFIRRSPNHD